MSVVAATARGRPRLADVATWPREPFGWAALALLAYLPVLRSAPGTVAADTKQYLYLDPARLMGRAVSMWDPNVGMGTVTHQTIGYVFPMGPYYWALDRLGAPDWVAQRLWLGSLMFAAAAGVLYLLRSFGLRGPGVVVAALAYMLTPYSLDYAARISVLLMPWAALPWMIGLVRKGLHDGGWRYPAIFALVVQVVGGVNATALIFAGVGPVLWIAYSWLIARDVDWRRAWTVAWRTGALTVATSLWWIAGLSIQGGYGLNVLRYTETVEAVARTSTPNEVLRGLGYWFFYGQDRLGPWIEASENYTQRPVVILAGYALAALALLSAGLVRWRHRAFFVALLVVGVVIAVGAHPYGSPTPLGAVFKAFATGSTAGLALRSTGRAVPLVVLATAVLLGVGVHAVHGALRRAGRPVLAGAAVGVVVALVVVNFPALADETYYGENLRRPEDVPAYWREATRFLDGRGQGTRVLELPGADFASYRWGNTVDPITPGLMDRPYVARELIPYGGPGTADLLNALDRRIQEGLFDPRGFAALARRMGVGDVVLRNDVQHERYDLVSARELARAFADVPGLGAPIGFGTPVAPVLARPHEDETSLAAPAGEPPPHPVVVYPVADPVPIVRAESDAGALVVAGDGEGLVDVADVGLLDGAGVVRYAASFPDDASLRAAVGDDAVLVVTDSNRRRARKWSTVRDNLGLTEQPGEEPMREDLGDARLDVFPGQRLASQTVTDQRGVHAVTATAYGNVITYTPEDRASRALDGDPETAWRAGAFGPAIGQRLRLELDEAVTTDHVGLVQPVNGGRDRYVTEVTLRFDDGDEVTAALGGASRVEAGQTVRFTRRSFRVLEVEVTGVNVGERRWHGGADAVGFAEIRVRDDRTGRPVRVDEVVRMPTDLLAAVGASSLDHPLVLVMARERVVPVPPRRDPEPAIVREFVLPTARRFALTGTARVTSEAGHAAIDAVLGLPAAARGGIGTDAREFLHGCVACRADAAIDGDLATAWQTPFVGVRGQWVEYVLPEAVTFDRMDLAVVADGRHSLPTRLVLDVDGAVRELRLPPLVARPEENATVTVPVSFPDVTGRRIRVTIDGVDERRTYTLYDDGTAVLPAAIAELGIPGVRLARPSATVPAGCRDDLLTIDGGPVAVRVVGTATDAEAMRPLAVELCGPPLELAAGRHELRAVPGTRTALQLDRIVLASAAGGGALAAEDGRVTGLPASGTRAPRVEVTDDGRTRLRVRVDGADAPFWLVLGQSHSSGWTARASGASLGEPQLVDGYANGWRIDPQQASFDVVLEWTPQRRVWFSFAASTVAVLGCVVVAAWARRRRRAAPVASADDGSVALRWPADGWAGPSARAARVGAPVAVAALGAVVAAPWVGVVAGGLVAVAQWRPAVRAVLVAAPAALMVAAGLYVVYGQRRHQFDPIFEWPTLFPRARSLGWLAVVLVAADAVVDVFRTLRLRRGEGGRRDDRQPVAG